MLNVSVFRGKARGNDSKSPRSTIPSIDGIVHMTELFTRFPFSLILKPAAGMYRKSHSHCQSSVQLELRPYAWESTELNLNHGTVSTAGHGRYTSTIVLLTTQ